MSAYIENGVRKVGAWICDDCGAIGTMSELNGVACKKEHKPCKYCGCAPLCAPDCPGMMELLDSPDVHIAGDTRTKKNRGA